ncbi:MAG: glutamine--fructose-6-phosphate transaminase (isomerizing) [Gemmatimonadales bacterium]|nr:glutamine--fructose-6-phosphate transaminase (isomerizing) [Gemmatimonadales bacterium]NIN12793.1 glutamine--fructose-6-phosphate transaminase (isomerizing) [Gemmatimonadales bacterium]NIN48721.1 glutamine--fructose-6-phosphate transaminase (isomerizing) [Gemmatimonadales bacterium]NIP06185.1 glutamine--fructose-6-phosphate transaminase (isomerizing) [Gemmatimonadales bacterium]NIR01370.1 glutamine--fructose-6-phosphate transaminase (isomerizing) [Gemmatimonadales bacterium]
MCGIVGYVGKRQAVPLLLEGLRRLEYRGYDSAGLAVQNGCGVEVLKLAGRVRALIREARKTAVDGTCGIAHTRWATHGAPTSPNAHPHTDCSGTIALVHNGIIENADALRARLKQGGHHFKTQTDTEVLAHLIEEVSSGSLEQRVISALGRVEGAYGIAVISQDDPGKIVVARKGSPVLLGVGNGEFFVASDAAAVLEHTRSVVYLDDGDVAVLTTDSYRVIDASAREQLRSVADIDWDLGAIELGGYPHFMLKEICEQPDSIRSTLRGRLLFEQGDARLHGLNLSPRDCENIRRIVVLACGTSWHAGLVGRYAVEELAGIPVDVEYASEYRYRPQLAIRGTLAIAISQSGETADTLEAMSAARAAGGKVLGLVNVVGSTIARQADGGLYLHAGPEIGVASTKAFTSQIVALVLLGLHLGRQRGLSLAQGRELVYELARLPEQVDQVLDLEPVIEKLAREYAHADNFLYLGRGVNFPVALEGALKLKEISYIHAEGYPAAEMKHGPIALIDENMPVVFVAPEDQLYHKVLSNMQEVKARGGRIIALTTEGAGDLGALADHEIQVPKTVPLLSPVVTSIPLQVLAYHIAVLRGCDVDRPRNLAKSVTVE